MNGKEAFSAMSEIEFNLVILDLNLPDINGMEVADHLEVHHPNTPIIFITGDHSAEALTLEGECRNRDDRQFIHKPITSDQLFTAVDRLVKVSLMKGVS